MPKDGSERAALEKTIQTYYRAMYDSDGAAIDHCFHPSATVCGFDTVVGDLVEMDRDGFRGFVEAQPAAAERGEPYDMKLASVDIKGRTAMVKVEDLYLGKRFTDYLLLVKDGGRWRILNKVWHADPAPARAS